MKKIGQYILGCGLFLLIMTACTKEEIKYDTSVVRDFEIRLNGEPWSLNTGISTKPIFVYKEDGEFFANYSSHYRFALEKGTYYFVASDIPTQMISSPVNLNDLIIPQSAKADQKVNLSAAVPYKSPFNDKLTMDILSRTGTLRLKATDTKADKSYSIIRTIVAVKRVGYKTSDETFVQGDMDISRSMATSSGGINYTDDFILFRTDDSANSVRVRFELMNQDSVVLKTKELAGSFPIFADSITNVDFNLNDPDTPIIQDYKVTINSAEWTDESFNPGAPVIVPEGYTYVSPADNIGDVYNAMVADPSVAEVNLFLKANETYQWGRISISKPLSVKGQNPIGGKAKATLEMGNVTKIEGDIDFINFENLILNITDAYGYNFDLATPFHVNEIKYKGCNIDNLSRALWRNDRHESTQLVDNFILDDCTFMNFAAGGRNYALINIAQDNTISNIELINSTIEIIQTGFRGPIIGNQVNQNGADVSITVHNCTFSLLGNPGINPFDFRADNVNSLNINFEKNLFSGVSNGEGTWLILDGSAGTKTIANNYRAGDFIMADWGVSAEKEPVATSNKSELFEDYTTGNLLIKDKTSDVYLNSIGDPRWIK